MHGRTRLVIFALALALACWLPSTAAAAPMPAGTYDVHITDGKFAIGSLTEQSFTNGSVFSVPIGTTPVSQPIGLTIPDIVISTPLGDGTATVSVTGAGVTIDPTDGSATADATFFISASISGVGSCSVGSSGSPISVHLTTTAGSPWDATTGAFQMADKTFTLPAASCGGNAILATAVNTVLSGANSIILNGIATRQADTPPATTPPATTPPPGGTTTPSAGNPNEVTPVTTPTAKSCVVPKLVGKTLKQAKRALKKAGCKVGRAKKKNSKKRKKGRILKQRYKAGTKLPAGTKVPITVSKGQKKSRKR